MPSAEAIRSGAAESGDASAAADSYDHLSPIPVLAVVVVVAYLVLVFAFAALD
jgi:hypothetical protein